MDAVDPIADDDGVMRSRVLVVWATSADSPAGHLGSADVVVVSTTDPGWDQALRAENLDVIVCDADTAGTVLTHLRTSPPEVRPPLLVLTTAGTPTQRSQLLRDGATEYLLTPYDPDELRRRVAALAGASRDRRLRVDTANALVHANRQLERFAYTASHDLKEPLRAISGFSQLLHDRYADSLDDSARIYLDFIVDGADRLGRMINALLDFSRWSAQKLVTEPVDLGVVLADTLEELADQAGLADGTVTVEALPEVRTDRAMIANVIRHLLSNATTYVAEDRPLQVTVTAERGADRWLLHVTDTGCGIAPKDQERIFDMFTRLHSREQHPGEGFGLALVTMLMQRMGGSIEVDSTKAVGTTMTIELPDGGPPTLS